MVNKTKIAVLGAGRWGTHLVRNFLKHPKTVVVAVVDRQTERLAALGASLELNNSILLATDLASIPKSTQIEAVAIATPASTHYTLIKEALQRGYHVLAEKPLTLDVNECLELCCFAQQQQRQLMVDHTYLFHPAVWRAGEVIKSGGIGELRYGYAARTHLGPVRWDVNALWDLAIHDLAIFNSWLGQMPIKVKASGKVWLQRSIGKNSPLDQDLADLVQVTLIYATGFEAFIHLCWLNPDKQRRLSVVGTEGTLIFDEMSPEAPLTIEHGCLESNGNYFTPAGQSRQVLEIEAGQPLEFVCDHFLAHLDSCQPSPVSSGWVGTELVHILQCLQQSLQLGGQLVTVSLPKFRAQPLPSRCRM
ncbi:MAG: Gfo/Idh/MocA family oxidoreductase [Symploca sp. SIO3C6]|nr:Gfo/Idh/MocA family oxidoreductase [Symploca sp. SIO3C6]